jgi:hypothetical protein
MSPPRPDAITTAAPQRPQPEKNGMDLVAYVGHYGDLVPNPLTGNQEHNGTSILDVTDPKRPKTQQRAAERADSGNRIRG